MIFPTSSGKARVPFEAPTWVIERPAPAPPVYRLTPSVIPVVAQFLAFPKIQRYENATCVITEKIDGTNACLNFDIAGALTCQSRNKIITPGKLSDNAGFAEWAYGHADQLFEFFGSGRHFGEWWGVGIQRGYGLVERRFTPFNSGLYGTTTFPSTEPPLPANVALIPVLWTGPMVDLDIGVQQSMNALARNSFAAPGFHRAEGCMIWSRAFGYLKVPFDRSHKWEVK